MDGFPANIREPIRKQVWQYLPYRDLLSWCASSKEYLGICQDPATWIYLLKRDYNLDYSEKDARSIYRDIIRDLKPGSELPADYKTILYEYGPLRRFIQVKHPDVRTTVSEPGMTYMILKSNGYRIFVHILDTKLSTRFTLTIDMKQPEYMLPDLRTWNEMWTIAGVSRTWHL